MKNELDKKIAEIDIFIKQETGIDLAKQERREQAIRRMFIGLDLNTVTFDGNIFMTKNRMKGLVH